MTDLLIQQVSRLFHESTILIMEQVAENAAGSTTVSQKSINSQLSGSELKESLFLLFLLFLQLIPCDTDCYGQDFVLAGCNATLSLTSPQLFAYALMQRTSTGWHAHFTILFKLQQQTKLE